MVDQEPIRLRTLREALKLTSAKCVRGPRVPFTASSRGYDGHVKPSRLAKATLKPADQVSVLALTAS